MGLINTIKKGIQQLPGIRKPDTLMNTFMEQYGWTLQKPNKSVGDLTVYHNALNNVYVSQCVQVYCDESLNTGFSINNPDVEVNNISTVNYLTNLFNHPQGLRDELTFAMLNNQIWTSWLITGDAFIEISHDPQYNNVPIGFKYIPTELIVYFEDTDQWGLRNSKYRYEEDEIIHIYNPSIELRKGQWGTSIIDKIGLSIALELQGMKHNQEIFNNKGLDPKGILSFDYNTPPQTFTSEIKRLSQTSNKKGTMAVIGANYQKTNNTNQDMEFLGLMNYARDRIITAFGVQPSKIGIRETANLGTGTGESQDKDFKKTLSGKCRIIEDCFNKVLGRHGFSELFSYNELDIEDKRKRVEIENIQIRNGSRYINEVRAGYGLEPVSWGNIPLNYTQFGVAASVEQTGNVEGLGEELKTYKKAYLYHKLEKEY